MTKRFLGHFLLLLVVLFVLKKSLDFAFGWVLAEVFARGTNCEVDLKNPQLHFFPLSASVDDALIRHRSEPRYAGFRAKRISIRLHFFKLFQKELLLSDLELRGARAKSDGTDTGFIQTFAFLFPPKDPNAPPPPAPSGWEKWLKSWVFHITTIRIVTDPRPDQLVIGFRGQRYLWDKVDVQFIEQDSDAKKPYDLAASGENFRFHGSALEPVPLGLLKGRGEIGLGRLLLTEASVGEAAGEAPSATRARGSIQLAAPGEYDIALKSSLSHAYLENAFGGFVGRRQNLPESLGLTGSVKGTYLAPKISGSAEARFPPGALLPGRVECGIRDIRTDYELGTDGIRFSAIAVEDVVKRGAVTLSFSGAQAVHGSLEAELDREKRWMQSCFLSGVAAETPALHQAATDALADSHSEISVEGTLNPFHLKGSVQCNLSLQSRAMQSKLTSDFQLTSSEFKLTLQERGAIPQIQPEGPLPSADAAGTKTPFHRALNSNIDVDIRYVFENQMLHVERLNILRYPTERILARVGPFLGDSLYRTLLAVPASNSLLDVDFRGMTNFHDLAELDGSATCSNIAPFGVPIDRIRLTLASDGQDFRLKDVAAEILGGSLRGSLQYGLSSRNLAAKFLSADLHLENIAGWRAALPYLQTSLSGGMTFEGTLPQLSYYGTFDLETSQTSEPDSLRKSRFEVTGDAAALKAHGTIVEPANTVDVVFPFSADDKAAFQADIELKDFPLDYLFPARTTPETEEVSTAAQGGLTGALHYQGPYRSPLLGEGTVQISRLWLNTRDLSLEQGAPLEASIRGGRLIFTNARLLSSGRELVLTGFVDHESGWNALIAGRWELSSFLRRVEMLEQTSGQVQLDLRITGPAGKPVMSGPVRLSDGSISFPLGKTIVGVNDLIAEGMFSGQDLVFDKIEGRVGGAKLTGTAAMRNIVGAEKLELTSDFSFRRVGVEPVDHLTFEVDGDISLNSAPEPAFVLAGNIFLRSGQYENVVKLSQVLQAITRTIIGSDSGESVRRIDRRERSFSNLGFDVRMRAPSGFLLDTNVAQAELRGDVHLTGTLDQPLLDGKIEAIEGAFGLGAQEFELLNGEAAFFSRTNSIDPRISLVGETKVLSRSGEEHQVRLNISGTITQPRVSFSSDSGLRRDEIQSLVGLGANFEALDFLYGGKHTRTFAELINPSTNVSIEERLRGLTKFETVRIDTSLSPVTGEFVPRVVAKRPVVKRVDLDIQSELGGRRSSSAQLEYELTPYLGLIGGWRNGSARRDVDQGSGSLEGGIHYRTTFPGFRLVSPKFSGSKEDEKEAEAKE